MSYTEFYVRSGGTNMNAGSTDSDSAAVTITGGDWDGTSVFTKTGAISGISVGDFVAVYLDGDTSPTSNQYLVGRVSAVTANTVTVPSTARTLLGTLMTSKTAQATLKAGGAWGGSSTGNVAHAFTFPDGNTTNTSSHPLRVNVKAGTWNVSSGMTARAPASAKSVRIEGYTSAAGDGGEVIIDAGANSITVVTASVNSVEYAYITVTNNGSTNVAGWSVGSGTSGGQLFYRCKAIAIGGNGFAGNVSTTCIECHAAACNVSNTANVGGFSGIGFLIRCISSDHSGSSAMGFRINASGFSAVECIADKCGGRGFQLENGHVTLSRCVAHNCGGSGFYIGSNTTYNYHLLDCISVGNAAYGIDAGAVTAVTTINFATYNNTSGRSNVGGYHQDIGAVTLAASPFTNAGTGSAPRAGDFGVTTGSALRGAGSGYFLQDSGYYNVATTSYPDVGAVQHQDSGGGLAIPVSGGICG